MHNYLYNVYIHGWLPRATASRLPEGKLKLHNTQRYVVTNAAPTSPHQGPEEIFGDRSTLNPNLICTRLLPGLYAIGWKFSVVLFCRYLRGILSCSCRLECKSINFGFIFFGGVFFNAKEITSSSELIVADV